MTLPGDAGIPGPASEGGEGKADSTERYSFESLESQLKLVAGIAGRIVFKHWPKTERERYPFWGGIIVIAFVLLAARLMTGFTREFQWVPLVIALLMLVVLVALLIYYVYRLQSRFERQWAEMSADGEMYRFLHDSGVALGHPVEMGQLDEQFYTRLEVPFPGAVSHIEAYLRKSALPDDAAPGESGLHVPQIVLQEPHGAEGHRVYEVEYRGSVVQSLSIRVSAVDGGTEITIGFTRRPVSAESRERMAMGLTERLQIRLIAARVLADIRKQANVPPVPVSTTEEPVFAGGPAPSRAV